MDSERLQILLQRRFDQVLTADEHAELEQMLLANPRARAAFWEAARWHALIRQWGEAKWGQQEGSESAEIVPLPPVQSQPMSRPPRKSLGWAAAAAALLTTAALAWWTAQSAFSNPRTAGNTTSQADRTTTQQRAGAG